jgi:DNA mismatch endonuclease (patch repair protein)
MSDCFTPEARSAVMRAVKSTNTMPELRVQDCVRSLRRRYRLGGEGLPGKPDLVFRSRHCVIFVHGCFWHGHDCARGMRIPQTNADYWRRKIDRNRARDTAHLDALTARGWRVLTVWECQTRDTGALRVSVGDFLR